jgi:polysaccharide export outer membrane protein
LAVTLEVRILYPLLHRHALGYIPLLLLLALNAGLGLAESPQFLDNKISALDTTPPPVQPLSGHITFLANDYRIGPNDELDISFFSVPELNQKNLRVTPDGNIMLPALGQIKVAGMTVGELSSLLTERYKKYLKQPDIAVNLVKLKPFIVLIKGAVLHAGSYEFNQNPSDYVQQMGTNKELNVSRTSPLLSNVLIAAGGLTHDADVEHIEIHNQYTGEVTIVNILELLGSNEYRDIYLSQGDMVIVPRLPSSLAVNPEKYRQFMGSSLSQTQVPVRVYGYVKSPGLYHLPSAQTNTLHSAIVSAGGYYGDFSFQPTKVYLSRVDENGRIATRQIDPRTEDPVLMPNDIIYIPEKTVGKIHRAFRIITDLTDPFFRSGVAYNTWAQVVDPTRNFPR